MTDMAHFDRQLIPVTTYCAMLQYDITELPGAVSTAYLDPLTVARLDEARAWLRAMSTDDAALDLLLWDAYRTPATQQAIYDDYADRVAAERGVDAQTARALAAEYVTRPETVFPHGTGGAVDLTLLINGRVADMGTEFDEFNERSHKDHFREHPPLTDADRVAHHNRELLRTAMERAGFVGLDQEWWHYEYGTRFWALRTGQPQLLHAVHQSPPPTPPAGPAYHEHVGFDVQPVRYTGVAQRFASTDDRSAALRGTTSDHFYARTSHPTLTGLSHRLRTDMIHSQYCSLVASGFNAARTTLTALVPRAGVLLCDRRVYYEVGHEIHRLAEERRWDVQYTDLTNLAATAAVLDTLRQQGRHPDVVYCDSPMNWWLEAIDLPAVRDLVAPDTATIVVDVSVQPMREQLLRDADVAICSLSKYPSIGIAIGGAVFTNDAELHAKIEQVISRTGVRMSSETAATIWEHAMSLDDRLSALQTKVLTVAAEVEHHPAVAAVRYADPGPCGGRTGGMLILDMRTPALAAALERTVSHNANGAVQNLHLAYTFGGFVTTIEHFASNPRIGGVNDQLGVVPNTFVRIGMGCERAAAISSDLTLALNCVSTLAASRVAA